MSNKVRLSESERKKEDWMNAKWRPMMGWMYMVVCITDMVVFPVLWSLLQTSAKVPLTQWNPLTLQGAGLFHIAMGAVLGLAAWGRTQEKLNGANNGGLQPVSQSVTTTYGSAQAGGFGGSSFRSHNATAGGFGGGFGGNSFESAPGNSLPQTVPPTPGMPTIGRRPMGPAQPIDDDYMPPRD